MVEFDFKIAWRRSYGSNHYCQRDMIQEKTVLAGQGVWNCVSGCASSLAVSSGSYVCTDFSELEDWTQGENSFQYTFEGPGPFVIM
jgi:hypothetical protein